jgi:hypothetical protein
VIHYRSLTEGELVYQLRLAGLAVASAGSDDELVAQVAAQAFAPQSCGVVLSFQTLSEKKSPRLLRQVEIYAIMVKTRKRKLR